MCKFVSLAFGIHNGKSLQGISNKIMTTRQNACFENFSHIISLGHSILIKDMTTGKTLANMGA